MTFHQASVTGAGARLVPQKLLPEPRRRTILRGMNNEPIVFARTDDRPSVRPASTGGPGWTYGRTRFDRAELNRILSLYGRMVVAGEWRDYAIDFVDEAAVFSIFRRTSEMPLYRVEKRPRLKDRQGQYAVVAASGHIMRRGHDLPGVLRVLERKLVKAVR